MRHFPSVAPVVATKASGCNVIPAVRPAITLRLKMLGCTAERMCLADRDTEAAGEVIR
jgi:hypothetical protein